MSKLFWLAVGLVAVLVLVSAIDATLSLLGRIGAP